MAQKIGAISLLALVALSAAVICTGNALGQEQMGAIKGTAQFASGKPLTGVWIIISNHDLGTSYRDDSGPQGQFEFQGVFPGKYVFGFSPAQFEVRSPSEIQVQPGETLSVTVVVAPSSNSTPD